MFLGVNPYRRQVGTMNYVADPLIPSYNVAYSGAFIIILTRRASYTGIAFSELDFAF